MKAPKKRLLFQTVLYNKDFEVLKYISSFDGVILDDKRYWKQLEDYHLILLFIYLLNYYLRQNTPSHLRNEIDIFQFSNHSSNNSNNTSENNKLNNINNENNIIKNDNIDSGNNNNNDNNNNIDNDNNNNL